MHERQEVHLRDVLDGDIAIFFEHQREPAAAYMVALSTKKPQDWASFQAQWERIQSSGTMTAKTIEVNGVVAGYVASFHRLGKLEVSYWLGSRFWGRGLATAGLTQFLLLQTERPVYARVAQGNPASVRVLEKCGFDMEDADGTYTNAEGEELAEFLMILRPR